MGVKKHVFFLLSLVFLSSCAKSLNYTKFPEQINPDTGLREFRLQRQDCINTPYEHLDSRCSKNENVVVTTNEDTKSDTVVVKELTPWLTVEKAKTVVEPTLQFDERNQKVIVNSVLRINDKPGSEFTELNYVFHGSLKDFRDRYKKDKTERYVYLEKKSGGGELVNALLYCVERPQCHEVAVVFSFYNVNNKGERFLDSRTFQIDARESKFEKTDALPGQAKPKTLTVEVKEVEIPEILTDEADPDSSGLFEAVLPPILPQDKKNHLCKGANEEECPKYLLDPTLPSPNRPKAENLVEAEEEGGVETQQEESKILDIQEQSETQSTIIEIDEQEGHSSPGGPSTLIDASEPEPPSSQTQSVIIDASEDEAEDLPKPNKEDESQVNLPDISKIPKPQFRPTPEEIAAEQNKNPLGETRPEPKPEVRSGPNYLQSIDGKFSYDLSKCADKLNKIKNAQFHQAKGFYSEGRLEKASLYKTLFRTNRPNSAHQNKQYASGITNLTLEFAACVLEQRYNRVKIDIHDFSSKNGGKLGGHGSHQNGLDVDVSYPHINDKTKGFDIFTSNSDEERTVLAYDYAKILYATDRVHIIFTDTQIKNKFCTYLKKHNKLKENRSFVDKKLRHISGHRNHYHIRMKCTSQNEYCKPQGTLTTSPCGA